MLSNKLSHIRFIPVNQHIESKQKQFISSLLILFQRFVNVFVNEMFLFVLESNKMVIKELKRQRKNDFH
jgi:hypothetical protein